MTSVPGEVTLVSVRLFVALIALVVAVSLVARKAGLPYSVALVIAGLIVAAIVPHETIAIPPELVLAVLVPGLVFEAAYQTPVEALRRAFLPVILLAIPGVVVVATVVAAVLSFTTGLDPRLGFVVGAMVAATDPVAVIATFDRLRAPTQLSTLVEAESLLNDGTGIVLFSIGLAAVTGQGTGIESSVVSFVWVIVASTGLGVLTGLLASWAIAWTQDHQLELAISVVLAYGSYLAADGVHLSGIIATVVAGVTFGTYGRAHGMSTRAREAIDVVWDFLAFILTALVFLLIGLSITLQDLAQAAGPIGWGIVAILVGRALVVYLFLGGSGWLLRSAGREPGLPLAWLHVMFWAGLRGAVSVALALSLPADLPNRDLLQDITFGVVLFTLVVQGTTAGPLVRRALGLAVPRIELEGTPP